MFPRDDVEGLAVLVEPRQAHSARLPRDTASIFVAPDQGADGDLDRRFQALIDISRLVRLGLDERAIAQHVTEALRGSVRSTDFVARYGGEEFAILLPSTDAASGRAVGEQARCAVADAGLDVTISVGGGTGLTRDGTALSDAPEATLAAIADTAQYDAKRAGRNRTVVV